MGRGRGRKRKQCGELLKGKGERSLCTWPIFPPSLSPLPVPLFPFASSKGVKGWGVEVEGGVEGVAFGMALGKIEEYVNSDDHFPACHLRSRTRHHPLSPPSCSCSSTHFPGFDFILFPRCFLHILSFQFFLALSFFLSRFLSPPTSLPSTLSSFSVASYLYLLFL